MPCMPSYIVFSALLRGLNCVHSRCAQPYTLSLQRFHGITDIMLRAHQDFEAQRSVTGRLLSFWAQELS